MSIPANYVGLYNGSGLWGFAYSIGEGAEFADAYYDNWSGGGGTTFSNLSATIVGSNLVVTGDLDGNAQSITVALSSLGASTGDVINIDPYYDTNPSGGSEVMASASSIFVTPVVYNPSISGTESSGNTLTGSFDYIVGPPAQVITQLWSQCDTSGDNCNFEGSSDTTVLLDSDNVGYKLKYIVYSVLDSLTGSAESSLTGTIT